jgi:hypothetical protein
MASRLPLQADDAPTPRPESLVMDAMGELRMDYEEALIRDMLASGLDSITITLCDPKPVGGEALELAIDSLLQHDLYLAQHPGFFVKAVSVADVDRARREGKLAVFYLYQNTVQFGRALDRVDLFHRLGVRSCQLTYNDRNDAGAGCDADGGITSFGRELIGRMNARRMLVDLSHANMQTMAEAIQASTAPVHVSHTACTAVHPNRRNTTDENQGAGISVDGDDNTFDQNRGKKNGFSGLEVFSGIGNLITRNTFDDNIEDGIFVDADFGTIDGNRGRRNGDDGLEVFGIGNTVSNNSFEDNGDWNICVALGNTNGGGTRKPPITFTDCP